MCNCTTVSKVPKVVLDDSGDFKYILIKIKDYFDKEQTIIRGAQKYTNHSDIFDQVQESLNHLTCEVLGGGKIFLDPDNKMIKIYGSSKVYSKADHNVTAEMLKEAYPNFEITVINEEE